MPAAFVADIYSQQVAQGPSLPQAQRQALTKAFTANPALYVARMQAALDEACPWPWGAGFREQNLGPRRSARP